MISSMVAQALQALARIDSEVAEADERVVEAGVCLTCLFEAGVC